jgi:ribosomal protein S18 acetylase RimI-like enzyme
MTIQYNAHDQALTSQEFVQLFSAYWSAQLDEEFVRQSLSRTINVTAREETTLVGCARILTDFYLFSVITEILVHPQYSNSGVGRKLIELAEASSPTSLCFGSQSVSEKLMNELGWKRGPHTYFKRKPLPTDAPRSCD